MTACGVSPTCHACCCVDLQVAPPPPVLSPGAAAGVAVGGMAALCGIVGLAVWLVHRRRQQSSPADKDDGASSQGSGRRVSDRGSLRHDSFDGSASLTKCGVHVALQPWSDPSKPMRTRLSIVRSATHTAVMAACCAHAASCSVGARASAGTCCLSHPGLGPSHMMTRQGPAPLEQQQQQGHMRGH